MVLAPRSSSLPKLQLKPGRWTVGSATTCSYRITAEGVRPRHALVMCGGQTVVLKAWDSHTWHNGEPVQGEVRLHSGDRVTIGSVEFSIESSEATDQNSVTSGSARANDQIAAPTSRDDADKSVVPLPALSKLEVGSSTTSETRLEGWDLERLREQIQELRDELSQRMQRRSDTAGLMAIPAADSSKAAAQLVELERTAAEARRLAELAQRELLAAREQHALREAELGQQAECLRPELTAARQTADELRLELDHLRSEASQREQAIGLQSAGWSAEREQWQEELISLATAQQVSAAEWEQRQTALLDEANRWQAECEQLRARWEVQQAAAAEDQAREQDESRQHAEAIQQALQNVNQREEQLAELSEQLLVDRQQLEAERQQLHDGWIDREQVAAERQSVERQTSEMLAKEHDFLQRLSDFEQQQSILERERQTLEHSWGWLNADRRKLVDEKEEWQQQRAQWQVECERRVAEEERFEQDRAEFAAARNLWQEQHAVTQDLSAECEQIAAERQQLLNDQVACAAQREQFAAERRTRSQEWDAALAELQLQQQALQDEQTRLQVLQAKLDARDAANNGLRQELVANEQGDAQQSPTWESGTESWSVTSRELSDTDGGSDAMLATRVAADDSDSSTVTSAALSDAWSIGVDLTAPREFRAVEDAEETHPASAEAMPLATGSLGLANVGAIEAAPGVLPPSNDWQTTDPMAQHKNRDSDSTPDSNAAAWDSQESASDGSDQAAIAVPAVSTRSGETATTPTNGPLVSILESMAFEDDEDVDDSVSRYMQHLLARSQPAGADSGDGDQLRSASAATRKPVAAPLQPAKPHGQITAGVVHEPRDPAALNRDQSEMSPLSIEQRSLGEQLPTLFLPVHSQDKEALRAATEQMRQVANQQTVKNVEASNWRQIKQSLKTKLILAAFSFLLSGGLLYWGYHYRPEFFILGLCASGLGILTWLDLLFAFRQGRSRTSKLAGRKKPAGSAGSAKY